MSKSTETKTFVEKWHEKSDLAARKADFEQFMAKIGDSRVPAVPVIIDSDPKTKSDTPELDKHRYAVPKDLKCMELQKTIKARIVKLAEDHPTTHRILNPEETLTLVSRKTGANLTQDMLISELYEKEKDEDGFLYINYMIEGALGA